MAANDNKVALITGGASGIGLSVAKILSSRNDWTIHILDINSKTGTQITQNLPRTTFHHTNVTNYTELSTAFQNAFKPQGRLDFVFANAGVFEWGNFYDAQPATTTVSDSDDASSSTTTASIGPPAEPEMLTIDLNLRGAVFTSYLSRYYFRCSPHKGHGANLVITASCVAFYETPPFPLYATSKYGVLGLMRSLTKPLRAEGIRVNAICPGVIRTNLIEPQLLDKLPQVFVDLEKVSETVVRLVDGGENGQGMTDASGVYVSAPRMYGLAVEICDNGNLYFRDQHGFLDEGMETVFGGVEMKARVETVLQNELDLESKL